MPDNDKLSGSMQKINRYAGNAKKQPENLHLPAAVI